MLFIRASNHPEALIYGLVLYAFYPRCCLVLPNFECQIVLKLLELQFNIRVKIYGFIKDIVQMDTCSRGNQKSRGWQTPELPRKQCKPIQKVSDLMVANTIQVKNHSVHTLGILQDIAPFPISQAAA